MEEGHVVLIFSQSRKMLDLIQVPFNVMTWDNIYFKCFFFSHFSQAIVLLLGEQDAIWSEGYKLLRIDGTTKISEREMIVKVNHLFHFRKKYAFTIFSFIFYWMEIWIFIAGLSRWQRGSYLSVNYTSWWSWSDTNKG